MHAGRKRGGDRGDTLTFDPPGHSKMTKYAGERLEGQNGSIGSDIVVAFSYPLPTRGSTTTPGSSGMSAGIAKKGRHV